MTVLPPNSTRPASDPAVAALPGVSSPKPARRGIVLERAIVGVVSVGLMAGVAHQMNKLMRFEHLSSASKMCESLAIAAVQTHHPAHPGWVYETNTLRVTEQDGPGSTWWRAGTPSFQCQVQVSAGEGLAGLRIREEPTVIMDYTVRFTGTPDPQAPLGATHVIIVPSAST